MSPATPTCDAVDELRANPRRNLLVLGRLTWDGKSTQVRVRNISDGGALLEITDVPSEIERAILTISSEAREGKIVWRSSNRVGFQFDRPRELAVDERVSTIGQARVDRHMGRAREEMHQAIKTNSQADVDASNLRISEELLYLQRRMENLGDVLSGDPILIVKYQRQLQDIDIMMQTLGHVSNVVRAIDRDAAISAIGMEELRRRLGR